ncbi:MAG TPA: hypothetical protein VGM97_16860 [Steroidobacteraceae bacterium]|jgi:hypothetical protein
MLAARRARMAIQDCAPGETTTYCRVNALSPSRRSSSGCLKSLTHHGERPV